MDYELEKNVNRDLEYCKDMYTKYSYDGDRMEDVFNQILFKYVECIDHFADGMDVISVYDDKVKIAEALRKNVVLIIKRLEIFKNSSFKKDCLEEYYLKEGVKGERIEIGFNEARKLFYENPELTITEKKEIEEKLDIIEEIYSSIDTKKNKWNRLRPMVMWASGKDVDIGLLFLSLIQKIN